MKNYIQDGSRLQFTNSSGSTISSGAGVLVGTKVGVACSDIPDGATGPVAMDGVYEVNKLSTDAVSQGAALYWDNTNKRLTTTSSGNTYAGFAHVAASGSVSLVRIRLNI